MGKTGLQKALWEPDWLVGGGEAREALLWLKNGETEIKAGDQDRKTSGIWRELACRGNRLEPWRRAGTGLSLPVSLSEGHQAAHQSGIVAAAVVV